MSVEELGGRLLGETVECGADEILKLLRLLADSNCDSLLNIPTLDKLLVHTGSTEFIQQRHSEEPLQLDASRKAIQKPTVLEITSEEPGAGKTHLLYLIVAVAVLPHSHDEIGLNGKHSAVVVFDTDERFSVERLVQVMRHYIDRQTKMRNSEDQEPAEERQHQPSEASITELISNSLQHVHIFRPQSLDSATATLSSLPSYLLNPSNHHSTSRPLHSIIIDSLTTFHWPARAASSSSSSSAPAPAPYAPLTQQLQAQAALFSAAVIGTSTSPISSAAHSARRGGSAASIVPRAWLALRPRRLRVARVAVPKFAPRLSVLEALRERDDRLREVERGRFEGVVDGSGGRFDLWIGAEGVWVGGDARADG